MIGEERKRLDNEITTCLYVEKSRYVWLLGNLVLWPH